eukprot:TRINITY_DN42396_c0_g1_i1.p1 TRINITY_DN42396_c0_g1~~TRINITY_DN42396_c0_g1_i1.p1  ORF type:complete len:191 (+),score=45.52 TRINITY_DN42396_c0_g1_i1:19-591(+)
MVRYSRKPNNIAKAAMARGTRLRVHFKKTREVGAAIKGMKLKKAQAYLERVLARKDAIPFLRSTGGCGRHAQGKLHNAPGDKVGWPEKPTRVFLDLLKNVEANAESKSLDVDKLIISHVQVNQAPKMRRRTYRAHGRINAYMCSPSHIELYVTERGSQVKPAREKVPMKPLTRKQQAIKSRLFSGRGKKA